ncbi:DUF1311 domain-containing protein [Yersinia enterocolitica]|nr:DUF1311 domain-containing protein [Yersinia enterocolitica]EKN3732382.1 DUF1311 domain-containing protein [Yersinia enterocolitica]EKN3832989.1 DUF1311 domain-containing protein [Yersinia enterocolitica]ELI8091410.1 DUF1311 domain-containing protein [Yersinia enterocolitica]
MNLIVNRNIVLLISLLTCGTTYAASFECKNAESAVETMICSDFKLNRLDDFLSHNYKIAINSEMPDGVKQDIKKSQMEWLDKRNDCSDAQCLKNMYAKRIDYLWDKCFEYVRGEINYVKYSDAMDVINQEERNQLSSDVINDSLKENESNIHEMGFTEKQLKSDVYIDGGSYIKYSTLGDYLLLMHKLPGFESIDNIDYKDYVGFRIKVSGQPYSGFVMREEGDELYLVGIISGNKVFEAVTLRDARSLSSIFINYANVAISNNAVK